MQMTNLNGSNRALAQSSLPDQQKTTKSTTATVSKTTGFHGGMNRQPTDLKKSTVKYADSSRESPNEEEMVCFVYHANTENVWVLNECILNESVEEICCKENVCFFFE